MLIELDKWYKIMAPRTTVLVSTIDGQGRTNAAPFSFVMPVSGKPPILAVAMAPTRHTLANIKETGDFVVNLPGEGLLAQLMICAKPLPLGVSEIKEAGLHEEKAITVSSPRIKECFGWFECKLREIVEAGDHQVVLGDILRAEAAEQAAAPLLHIGGADFSLPGKTLKAGSK